MSHVGDSARGTDRYSTAGELAADLGRLLDGKESATSVEVQARVLSFVFRSQERTWGDRR